MLAPASFPTSRSASGAAPVVRAFTIIFAIITTRMRGGSG